MFSVWTVTLIYYLWKKVCCRNRCHSEFISVLANVRWINICMIFFFSGLFFLKACTNLYMKNLHSRCFCGHSSVTHSLPKMSSCSRKRGKLDINLVVMKDSMLILEHWRRASRVGPRAGTFITQKLLTRINRPWSRKFEASRCFCYEKNSYLLWLKNFLPLLISSVTVPRCGRWRVWRGGVGVCSCRDL